MAKLFMTLLGCKPAGRHTEQHDVFFGIGNEMKDLVPDMQAFWPEAKDQLHVDGYREVNFVGNYQVRVVEKTEVSKEGPQLFFLNLGGYKPGEMEEFHYKLLSVNNDISEAIREAKQTAFFKHASPHVDDKYGVDVDEVYVVKDILPAHLKDKYQLEIIPAAVTTEDELHLGYFQLHKF